MLFEIFKINKGFIVQERFMIIMFTSEQNKYVCKKSICQPDAKAQKKCSLKITLKSCSNIDENEEGIKERHIAVNIKIPTHQAT